MDLSLSELQELVMDREAGVLRFMGSQKVGHDWATELNWTDTGIGQNVLFLWSLSTPLLIKHKIKFKNPTLLFFMNKNIVGNEGINKDELS